jgi:hypothetical protein
MQGADEEHVFDVSVSCAKVPGSGTLELHKLIDSRGNILSTDSQGLTEIERSKISIQKLKVKKPLTLAFKIHGRRSHRAPVEFDLAIDGAPATQRTFIGEALAQPVTMPFSHQFAGEESGERGRPMKKPDTPYCMIWFSKAQFEGETLIELDEKTREELRSLGYIQ